ncbi:MAG: chemotaxis-specific protein-glutamate methyltransferase CheB [Gammaproteobacteria bacterium]|jgi:chemotaxis response regulator CheB|nr:chemotaxis-specific protein-glutamate methyltransferase CheB [Gammaproteobacteria bacterium]
MKIAVVHAQLKTRQALARILRQSEHQLLWCIADNAEAVTLSAEALPDVILMDPQVNGTQCIQRIMQRNPCPILIVTDSIEQDRDAVFKAMGAGAMDAVAISDMENASAMIMKKIALLGLLSKSASKFQNLAHAGRQAADPKGQHLVLIGSSSGGPTALSSLLTPLPADYHSPIVILQHIDVQFASQLATWLDEKTALRVKTAQAGDNLVAGVVYIAASANHLMMNQDYKLYYNVKPLETYYRPSVDVLFHSVAKHWKFPLTAILLTGMGQDGAQGLLELRGEGAYTIAQDEQTSAVYGMPQAAARLGAAVDVLPIGKISDVLSESALETAKQCKICRLRGV